MDILKPILDIYDEKRRLNFLFRCKHKRKSYGLRLFR